MMKFFIETIRERAISPYTNMIATVFLALGMGIAMAQDNLGLSPANRDVTATAGSTDFTVTTNIPASDLTVVAMTSEGKWAVATANAAWEERYGHTSVVFDNKMWVIGGFDGFLFSLNDVWSSTDGITWTEATADAAWSAREDFTSVVFDGKMWVIGGSDANFVDLADVWNSTDGINWTEATADAGWSGRSSHTSVVFDNKMWVIGGYDADGSQDDVWNSTDGVTWTQVTTTGTIWSARGEHTSVVFDNKLWVIGGFDGSDDALNDVWNSVDGVTWTQATADAGWSARGEHTSVVYYDNDIWVIGGGDGSDALNDVWRSTDGITWTQDAADVPWSARDGHTSVVYDDDVWVIGGSDDSDGLDDVFFIEGWLAPVLSGTSSPYTLIANYKANSDTSPRTGTVTVSGGGLTETVTVTQAQAGLVFELTLSPATQSVTSEAGSTDFTVTTNLPSGALTTDDADWLTTELSGTTLTATYEANEGTVPRTGTVTVSGGGLTETVTVTQAGAAPELALSPANRDVTAEAGSTDFTVTTNVPLGDLTITTITDDADWLTVSLSGTSSPYMLTASYLANGAATRTGTVTVSDGGLTETVTVTQAGAAPELALSPANRDVTAEAGSTDFTVTTNVPSGDLTITTITDDADWLTVSLSGTSSPYMLTASYLANSIAAPRTGTVTVSGGGLTETVTVTQAGAAPELGLSPTTQSVTNETGSTDFMVTTNVPSDALTITDDADWLTVNLSGTTLTATYEANEGTDPRTGTVTVSGGGLTETVTVEQEGTPLGLEDEAALVVYPNPGSAQVTVDFGDMAQGEGKEWMLLDPSGKKVRSGSVARGEATLVINTQGLLSGLYLFQARGEGQNAYVSHRVVIRH